MDFARRLHPFRGMIELQNDRIPTKTRMQAMSLKDTLSTYWPRIQGELLPWLDDAMDGPLTAHHRQFVSVLGLARIETFLPSWHGLVGRPPAERAALACQRRRKNRPGWRRKTRPAEGDAAPGLPGLVVGFPGGIGPGIRAGIWPRLLPGHGSAAERHVRGAVETERPSGGSSLHSAAECARGA